MDCKSNVHNSLEYFGGDTTQISIKIKYLEFVNFYHKPQIGHFKTVIWVIVGHKLITLVRFEIMVTSIFVT